MTVQETITISKADFEKLAVEAFAKAAQQTVERMVELAGPALGPAVLTVGKAALAELGEQT